MHVDVIPTLIDQYRETFEGEVQPGMCWIVDGRRTSALFGTLETLAAAQAFASPVPGARSVAAHVAHLHFALDLTLRRLNGENPAADWPGSFELRDDASPVAWDRLRQDVRAAYDGVLAFLEQRRDAPPQDWPPIHLVGLVATIAHNAYHLAAIRQIAQVVRHGA
jgi:hypothetical protein